MPAREEPEARASRLERESADLAAQVSYLEDEVATLRRRVAESAGVDATWQRFHVIEDQLATLAEDVHRVTSHPLVRDNVSVGGFLYDVDTGLLTQHV